MSWQAPTFGLMLAGGLQALLLNAFDTLAMGNFPYPSNYLVYQQTRDPSVVLPAWPMRAACAKFAGAAATEPLSATGRWNPGRAGGC